MIGTQGDYDVITGNNTISAAAVLLAAGGITLVVAGIGICGAWGMWRLALVIVSTYTNGQTLSFSIYMMHD